MAVTTKRSKVADRTSAAAGATPRLPGPDIVRAVALIGVVVMNYHGYLIIEGGDRFGGGLERFFDPWTGPLSTRFATTFVLVAGVGVTLLTKRARSGERATEMRWRLVRRGALLYFGGLYLDTFWGGTIIPYYGAMFVLAAAMFTLRSSIIAAIGAASIVLGAALQVWKFWQTENGNGTRWLFAPREGSVQDYVFGVFVNGTHPLLPWFGYLCAGILLGRVLTTNWWRLAAAGTGLTLYAGATAINALASTEFQFVVLSTNPSSRSLVYVASSLGTALVAYTAVDLLATSFGKRLDPLRHAGQMTLTLYLLHIAVFHLLVLRLGWIEPGGLGTSLAFAVVFWIVAIAGASMWHARFGRGPAERVYRIIGG